MGAVGEDRLPPSSHVTGECRVSIHQGLLLLAIVGFVALFALVVAEMWFRPDDDDELSKWLQD